MDRRVAAWIGAPEALTEAGAGLVPAGVDGTGWEAVDCGDFSPGELVDACQGDDYWQGGGSSAMAWSRRRRASPFSATALGLGSPC